MRSHSRFAALCLTACSLLVFSSPLQAASQPLLSHALKGPMKGVEALVFAVRVPGNDPHWYANFGYWSSDTQKMLYGKPGTRLCRLNLRTGKVETLLDDAGGSIRDITCHYDGKTILFSYRKAGTRNYNLYEINADGSGLKQITSDEFDDIEAAYLPNDRIVFCSSRCKRWVSCWHTQVAILYTCNRDGSDIRQISGNIEHDNTPEVLHDGRILFTRWEYVDRSQVAFHHLWSMNPDGTGEMVFFGNQAPGIVMIDSKPIPRSKLVASIFSPGHGRTEHVGRLALVDPDAGPDAEKHALYVPGAPFNVRDPHPFSRHCFIVAQGPRLLLVDSQRKQNQVLHALGPKDRTFGFQIHEPVPLQSRRREPVIQPRTDWSQENGYLILQDIVNGRNMNTVKKSEIKKLLVLEQLPKPANFSGGPEELSWLGTFNLERVLGTVPVEADGSAYLELPANRPVFFVALDENDLSVKRMQSFVSVRPGETTSCVGCHEQRVKTPLNPPATVLQAAQRPPSPITPVAGVPDVFDFPKHIQPILDKHCIKCHTYTRRDGDVILEGDLGPTFSHSFWTLMAFDEVSDGCNGYGNNDPRSIGSSASRLMNKIGGGHYDVRLSRREWDTIRLWIEAGASYAGTYAALGTPGAPLGRLWQTAGIVFQKRCYQCHSPKKNAKLPFTATPQHGAHYRRIVSENDPITRLSIHILINLTRPELSPLLLGPLAKEAGGYGTCTGAYKELRPFDERTPPNDPPVFKSTNDPGYKKIIAGIKKVRQDLYRFELAGFRPHNHYIRELKRFRILPQDFNPHNDPIDPYETDRAYWKSLWHTPKK